MYFFTTAVGGSDVVGGVGALERLGALAASMDAHRALIVTSAALVRDGRILQQVAETISPLAVEVFSRVRPGSPMDVVNEGAKIVEEGKYDLIVSLGGGSAVDTAKGIVWHADRRSGASAARRHIAIPSTLSGAEFTTDAGLSVDGHKRVLRDSSLIPAAIILDPRVLATSPKPLLRASVLNAFAHCVEGAISKAASPMTQAYHLHALRLLRRSAPAVASDDAPTTDDLVNLQAAAALAAINQITMGIAHVLVHALGGLGTAPHALKHGAIAPLGLAFNASYAPDGVALLGDAFGVGHDARSAVMSVREFTTTLGAPVGLRDLGLDDADRDTLVERTMIDSDLATNPRPVAGHEEIRELLHSAWADIDVGISEVLNASTIDSESSPSHNPA